MTEPVVTSPIEKVERAYARFVTAVLGFAILLLAGIVGLGVAFLFLLGDVRELSTVNCRGVAILESFNTPEAQAAGQEATGRAVLGIIAGVNAHTDAVHGIVPTTTVTGPTTTSTTYRLRPDFERCK